VLAAKKTTASREKTKFLVYFAYGSNMFVPRLRKRVRSAKVQSVGKLTGYLLRFHKRSSDGSGKCNAFWTGNASDEVHGVLFAIDERHKPNLDRAEGLGEGYREERVDVTTSAGPVRAFVYLAEEDYIAESLRPYKWYKQFVVRGARQNGLPEKYVTRIEAVEAVEDPKKGRQQKNWRILNGG